MLDDKQQTLIDPDRQHAPVYPADIQPLMQSLLATLADIDFEHEKHLERLDSSEMDFRLREKLVQKWNDTHQARRDPYVQQLAALYEEVRRRLAAAAAR